MRDRVARASELFTALAYDDETGVFLLEDQSLGFGFLCQPLSGADPAVAERVNVLLNQEWPADTLLQISLWTSPDIDVTLASLQLRRLDRQHPTVRSLVATDLEFLRRGTREPLDAIAGVRIHRHQILVTVKLPASAHQPTDDDLRRAAELRIATQQSLATIGMRAETLSADRYVRLMNALLNWSPAAGWHDQIVPECDENQLIRDQLFDYDNDLRVDARGLWLGAKRVKTLSVKRFPDRLYFGSAQSYLGDLLSGSRGIRQNVLLAVTLHFPDAESARSRLDSKRQWITNQAYGPILKFAPHLAQRKHSFDALFEAFQDGDRPLRAYFGVVLFCDADEEAQAVSNARVYFRELGFQLLEDRYFCLPFFLNCLPFGPDRELIRDSNRYRTLGTRHVIPLLPLFADWPGTGTPTLNLVSRNGQFVNVSLFDSGSNYNACIVAQSGSGKSFLTNELIVSHLAEGARVWVIDVGRSYQNLAEMLDGEFMEFTAEQASCLNPFELIGDWAEEADVVAGLVTAMAAPTEKLTDFQTASLKRVLKTVWDERGQAMTVDDIAHRLCAEADRRIVDVGEQLFPFTTQGEYGRFFNGANSVRFAGDFTVLELEELKGRKHLQQVVLLQLIYQIQQAMYQGERDRAKIVIIDESWDLLTMGDAATFMEHGFRRFRKYGGAAITITQSVNDLYRSPTGRAIVENSANMYLLGQKAEAIEGLKADKRLPLSDGGYALLKTVHTIPGAYSEIFLLTDRGSGIGRLIVDPFKRLLFSTRAEDVSALRQLRRQGLSLSEAIRRRLADADRRDVR